MKYTHLPVAGMALAAIAGSSRAQTFAVNSDVRPAIVNSRVVTQSIDDETDETLTSVRVFSYSFQEDPIEPYFLNDPGFNAVFGSGLTQGTQLNFSVLSNLRYWNGTGAAGFGETVGQARLRINRASTNVFVTGSSPAQNGFAIANVSSGGVMHAHLNTFLEDPTGTPATGIYFAAIDVGNTAAGIARSLPVYLLFNNGAAPAAFTRARSYVAQPFAGDVNFDGDVNTRDFNVLAHHFGQSGRNWLQGDLSEDGLVSSADFNLLLGGYGQHTVAPPLGAIVPEPAAAGFVILSTCLLRRARRINSLL